MSIPEPTLEALTVETVQQATIEALSAELCGNWWTADLTTIEETEKEALHAAKSIMQVAEALAVEDEVLARASALFMPLIDR